MENYSTDMRFAIRRIDYEEERKAQEQYKQNLGEKLYKIVEANTLSMEADNIAIGYRFTEQTMQQQFENYVNETYGEGSYERMVANGEKRNAEYMSRIEETQQNAEEDCFFGNVQKNIDVGINNITIPSENVAYVQQPQHENSVNETYTENTCNIMAANTERINTDYTNNEQKEINKVSIFNSDVNRNNPMILQQSIEQNTINESPDIINGTDIFKLSARICKKVPFKEGLIPAINVKSQAKETKKMIIEFILSGQCCIFRNKNGELYFFGPNAYYEELNESKAVTLIMDICRKLLNINTNEYDYSYFKGIYKLLSVTPEIHIPENYNTENLLAFKNSILNVKTNEVYENNGNIFITYNIIANFAPNLSDEFPTPNFDKFIDRYTGGDDLLKERLLQMLGYTISPDNDGQLFTILYGPPMTGKTTLLDFVRMLFSKEAISELSLEQCKEKFKLGELDGKAVNMCGDLSSDPIDNNTVAIIKKLTGNDGLTAEHKGKDPFRFKNKAKFIACTNHKITINVDDPGLARRMVFIPLLYPVEYKFSAEAVINTLLPEIDAIVIKLLNAYNRLRANNYVPQPISIGYGAETFLEVKSKDIIRNMHIADFFGSCCVFDPNEKIYIDTLYMAYMKFCQDNLFEYHKTQQSFTTELKNYLSGAVKNQQIEFSKFRLNNQPPKSGIKGIALKV